MGWGGLVDFHAAQGVDRNAVSESLSVQHAAAGHAVKEDGQVRARMAGAAAADIDAVARLAADDVALPEHDARHIAERVIEIKRSLQLDLILGHRVVLRAELRDRRRRRHPVSDAVDSHRRQGVGREAAFSQRDGRNVPLPFLSILRRSCLRGAEQQARGHDSGRGVDSSHLFLLFPRIKA